MTNLNELDRIPWEGGLSVYLWGIILAVLIGLETLAHCRWHHSLAGILGYGSWKKGTEQKHAVIFFCFLVVDATWQTMPNSGCFSFLAMRNHNKPFLPEVVFASIRL